MFQRCATPRCLSSAVLCLLVALASCHDARRENPFDPVRTPPVELTATVDDSSGTARLSWTRYAGSAPFGHYLILRSVEVLGGQQVDTVAVLHDAGQTAYTDTSVTHGASYVYRVSAVNSDGFEVPSPAVAVGPVDLPAVHITRLAFDSRSATDTLQWTPYAGRGFAAYHIRRNTAELAPADVAVLADPTATAYIDSNLLGATEYTYRVVVRTDRGEEVVSQGGTGAIHRLLAEWPLPVEPGEYVRLYARGPSGLVVLTTRSGYPTGTMRTLLYDRDGSLLEATVLPELYRFTGSRAANMAVGPAGPQALCLLGYDYAVLVHLPLREQVWEPFSTVLDTIDVGSARVRGQVSLTGSGNFDNAALWVNGVQVLSEDFDDLPSGLLQGRVNDWEFIDLDVLGSGAFAEFGRLALFDASATRASASWDSDRLRFETDVWPGVGSGIDIQLGGGDTLSRFTLGLQEGQTALEWACPSCDGDDQAQASLTESLPVVSGGRYRLTLEVADGRIRTAVEGAVLWRQVVENSDLSWASAAPVEETVAFTADELPFSVSPEGEFTPHTAFPSYVSELRSWTDPRGRGTRMGACLPQLGRVLTGLVPAGRGPTWPRYVTRTLGPRVSADAGSLSHPLSFDGAPDGRLFVLDAGNSRIVAFDEDGQYITQWGRRGSSPGQFDFGSGNVIPKGLDYSGSVAVDDDGRIYVADVANQRIQVFAP